MARVIPPYDTEDEYADYSNARVRNRPVYPVGGNAVAGARFGTARRDQYGNLLKGENLGDGNAAARDRENTMLTSDSAWNAKFHANQPQFQRGQQTARPVARETEAPERSEGTAAAQQFRPTYQSDQYGEGSVRYAQPGSGHTLPMAMQQDLVKRFPELGKQGSDMNRNFVDALKSGKFATGEDPGAWLENYQKVASKYRDSVDKQVAQQTGALDAARNYGSNLVATAQEKDKPFFQRQIPESTQQAFEKTNPFAKVEPKIAKKVKNFASRVGDVAEMDPLGMGMIN